MRSDVYVAGVYGFGAAGPRAASIGMIFLGVILLAGGVLVSMLSRNANAGEFFFVVGALWLGFGAFLLWRASSPRRE